MLTNAFKYICLQIYLCKKHCLKMNIIKICMIYKQCNYSILLLFYDFEFENVEIKQT